MRPGITVSSTGHALILAWGLIHFSSAQPFDVAPTEALPIEILSPEQFDAMTKGSKSSKKVDAPKQKAEKVAEADPDPKDDQLPVAKEDVDAPPPPPSQPPTAEAPPPPKPDPKPDTAKADAEKAAKAEAAKAAADKAAAEKAVAEKAAAAKAAADKAAADKAAAAKAEAIKAAQQEQAEKLAQEKAEKAAADKAAAEKAAQEKAEKLAQEKAEKAELEKLAKAEADKAAKEKADAEKQAKAEQAAKEKAAAEKAAQAAKAAERKFDPDALSKMINSKKSPTQSQTAMNDVRDASRKAASARETSPETTAGTSRGVAPKLSMSQRTGIDNAVHDQVMQCWNPPVGANGDGSLAVRVQFTLNPDGTLSGSPSVVNSSSNPAFRAAADAATRAVRRCSPLKLPADAYDYWRSVNINFDPKDMMGG